MKLKCIELVGCLICPCSSPSWILCSRGALVTFEEDQHLIQHQLYTEYCVFSIIEVGREIQHFRSSFPTLLFFLVSLICIFVSCSAYDRVREIYRKNSLGNFFVQLQSLKFMDTYCSDKWTGHQVSEVSVDTAFSLQHEYIADQILHCLRPCSNHQLWCLWYKFSAELVPLFYSRGILLVRKVWIKSPMVLADYFGSSVIGWYKELEAVYLMQSVTLT